MNVLWISFVKAIRQHVRSITPFIMQVLSTLILIIILGSALSGNFKTDDFISPVKVTLVNSDKGEASKEFINFLNNSNMEKLIKVSQAKDLKTAKELMEQNKCDGVIEIKSGFSEAYIKGNFEGIETFIIDNDKTSFQILSSIINGWKNNSSAIQTALKSGKSMDSILVSLQNNDKIIKEMPLLKGGRLPKAMDYYAITMVVMTLMFSGMNTLGRLQEGFLSDMKTRLMCTAAPIGYILTGELLGITLMSFLQMVFVILFAHFVYGANLGSSLGIVFGTLFLMALFGQMLAAVLTLGLKDSNAPQGIIATLAMGLSFLAGGFYTSPIKGKLGEFLVTYGTPNSLAQTAIFGSIYGGDKRIIFICMGMLALLSLIFLGLTIIFARRRILS